jgi:hypothetical protein
VSKFDIYNIASLASYGDKDSKKVESNQGQRIVQSLMTGLENRGYVVVMYNFFSRVQLFAELLDKGIYAIRTVRTNRIILPNTMKNHKQFDKNEQGSLDWRMHGDWQMAAAMWKDKKIVCLISTHAWPKAMGEEKVEVPCRDGHLLKDGEDIPDSFGIHYAYARCRCC